MVSTRNVNGSENNVEISRTTWQPYFDLISMRNHVICPADKGTKRLHLNAIFLGHAR